MATPKKKTTKKVTRKKATKKAAAKKPARAKRLRIVDVRTETDGEPEKFQALCVTVCCPCCQREVQISTYVSTIRAGGESFTTKNIGKED